MSSSTSNGSNWFAICILAITSIFTTVAGCNNDEKQTNRISQLSAELNALETKGIVRDMEIRRLQIQVEGGIIQKPAKTLDN
jgi:outer membrane murein-binding lipoprotein Lpp